MCAIRNKLLNLSFLVILFVTKYGYSTVYYVNDGAFSEAGSKCTAIGATSNDGKSKSKPAATIKQVVDAYKLTFQLGDTIYVDPGKYDYSNATYKNKEVILDGINGLVITGVDPKTTIIDYNCFFHAFNHYK